MNDVSVYVGRQWGGGALEGKSEFEAFSCSIDPLFQMFVKWKKLPLIVRRTHLHTHSFLRVSCILIN